MDTITGSDGLERLESVFLALGSVCRMFHESLKQWWIPFFTVDGAHTTVCGATVLCLVATDASRRLVPMAVAFVRSETTASLLALSTSPRTKSHAPRNQVLDKPLTSCVGALPRLLR